MPCKTDTVGRTTTSVSAILAASCAVDAIFLLLGSSKTELADIASKQSSISPTLGFAVSPASMTRFAPESNRNSFIPSPDANATNAVLSPMSTESNWVLLLGSSWSMSMVLDWFSIYSTETSETTPKSTAAEIGFPGSFACIWTLNTPWLPSIAKDSPISSNFMSNNSSDTEDSNTNWVQ